MILGKQSTFRAFLLIILCLILTNGTQSKAGDQRTAAWTNTFDLSHCDFSDTGRNIYFFLEPGYQLTLEGAEDGDSVVLLVTVLDQTQEVDNVLTRVVEEREFHNGRIIEISHNYFAFCWTYASVFYFGEDVDIYQDGKLIGHEGSWRAGENGAKAGLMIPGLALVGSSYYQEVAPGIAMDRARIVSSDTTFQTPAGSFEHCLITEETSALEPGVREYKVYAPDVGLIKDDRLELTKFGMIELGRR